MQVHLTSGQNFPCSPEQTILDAAVMAGLVLPHSCRTGRCSSCKARVIEGQSVALAPESGLSAADRNAGWILCCARTVVSELVLEIDALSRPLPRVRTLPCRIDRLQRLAEDVIEVELRLPPKADFVYLPGQYIDLISRSGIRRSYSLASAPLHAQAPIPLVLQIRLVPGGQFSDYWCNHARLHDLLHLQGPYGTFVLEDFADQDLVFLATGTGIAPIKAMLEQLEVLPATARPRQIRLYWGGRKPQDLYWQPQSEAPLTYIPVLSRPDSQWQGRRGYVQQALLDHGFEPESTLVYACGSVAMTEAAREQLQMAGLPARHFRADAFVSSGPAAESSGGTV